MSPVEAYLRLYRERLLIRIAMWMPKSIAYWVFIRMVARGESHWTVMDVLTLHDDWYRR